MWRGRRTVAVSWFCQDRNRRHLASRISFIDIERSRHLDVLLAVSDSDGRLQPAQIHAGGVAWFGDRLFVAATKQGIWEFNLGDIRQVRGAEARRLSGASGRGLPATALVVVRARQHPVSLRCSYLGRVYDDNGTPARRVLIGEHRTDGAGRIGEFSIPDDDGDDVFRSQSEFIPGIPCMQGAVRWGSRYFVSQSDAERPGALWSGPHEALEREHVALPIGCEDLALDSETRLLWTLGEHPWRRVVRAIPFAVLRFDD